MKVTPKHIARDLGITVHYCRILIRRRYKRPKGHPWEWTEKEAAEVRRYVDERLSNPWSKNGRDK